MGHESRLPVLAWLGWLYSFACDKEGLKTGSGAQKESWCVKKKELVKEKKELNTHKQSINYRNKGVRALAKRSYLMPTIFHAIKGHCRAQQGRERYVPHLAKGLLGGSRHRRPNSKKFRELKWLK